MTLTPLEALAIVEGEIPGQFSDCVKIITDGLNGITCPAHKLNPCHCGWQAPGTLLSAAAPPEAPSTAPRRFTDADVKELAERLIEHQVTGAALELENQADPLERMISRGVAALAVCILRSGLPTVPHSFITDVNMIDGYIHTGHWPVRND